MWAEHGMNLDESHKLIAKAVEIEPDNAAFLDSLAWVLYKQNKPHDALAPMLKAIEKNKKPDATLFDHLGDIYAALHQWPEARDAWTKAVKLEPNPQIQQKLDAASNKPEISRSTP
jgi:tetratricopeptide (TPR) repeat protein